jgi:hypothetical protein
VHEEDPEEEELEEEESSSSLLDSYISLISWKVFSEPELEAMESITRVVSRSLGICTRSHLATLSAEDIRSLELKSRSNLRDIVSIIHSTEL